jgi:hypothetical protein
LVAGHYRIAGNDLDTAWSFLIWMLAGNIADIVEEYGHREAAGVLDQIPGTHRLRTVSQVGETFPLTDTSNGKACLARMSEKQRRAIFENEQVSGDAELLLLKELDDVRQTCLAFDRDEHTDGISAVGASFFDRQGDLYAVSVRHRVLASVTKKRTWRSNCFTP